MTDSPDRLVRQPGTFHALKKLSVLERFQVALNGRKVQHGPQYARKNALTQGGVGTETCNYPTGGSLRTMSPMPDYDPRRVLAQNLARLMQHEEHLADQGDARLRSVNGVAQAADVSRPTVDAALGKTVDPKTGELRALGIDLVDNLARPFGLWAWQLLVPGLPLDTPRLRPRTTRARAAADEVAGVLATARQTSHKVTAIHSRGTHALQGASANPGAHRNRPTPTARKRRSATKP